MSRHLGALFALVVLIVLLAVALRQDPGYVLVSWGTTSVELSLTLAALVWFASLWCVVQLVLIERWILRLWRRNWPRVKRGQTTPALKSTENTNHPPGKA
jgi:uncharacterized protein HemY